MINSLFSERSTKTRDGSKRNSHREVSPKLFAKAGDELCPVTVYKEYRRRRPTDLLASNSRFYLKPLTNPKADVWFSHQPVGKNKLGRIMPDIAAKAQLQGRKVNHSCRKTFAQTLVNAGRPPTEVAHLGGWKSIQTINAYATPSMEQQAHASDIISSVMLPEESTALAVPTSCDPPPECNADSVNIYSNHTSSKSVSSSLSKQTSNPFAVLCGANISGGTFNINIVAGKRKFNEISSSQESV